MNFLIVKLSALGDIVQAFSVAAYLKQRFPSSTVTWASEKINASLVIANPNIDKVMELDLKSQSFSIELFLKSKRIIQENHYDVLFDLQGNMKSALVTSLAHADAKVGFAWSQLAEFPSGLATSFKYKVPSNNIRESYLGLVKSFYKDVSPFHEEPLNLRLSPTERACFEHIVHHYCHTNKTLVAISHATRWSNKQLDDLKLANFLKEISEKKPMRFLFLPGSQKEKMEALAISQNLEDAYVLEPLPIPVFQHLLCKMNLTIAMDSFALHLAGASHKPCFGFFGPSKGKFYAPPGSFFFQGSCPYNIDFEKRCPKLRTCETGACLKNASSSEILDCFNRFDF